MEDHYLREDETFMITPNDIFTSDDKAMEGDLAVLVTYQPWIIPWQCNKVFRFFANKQSNGSTYWYSVPSR